MPRLLLYLDECLDQRLLTTFTERDCDVLTVAGAGRRQLSDTEQLRLATAQGRVLVSHNQLHFRRLHQRFVEAGHTHAGIILLPQTVPLSRLATRMALLVD
jgi:hypothetical protein